MLGRLTSSAGLRWGFLSSRVRVWSCKRPPGNGAQRGYTQGWGPGGQAETGHAMFWTCSHRSLFPYPTEELLSGRRWASGIGTSTANGEKENGSSPPRLRKTLGWGVSVLWWHVVSLSERLRSSERVLGRKGSVWHLQNNITEKTVG